MRLYHLLALAAVVAQTSAVSKSTLKTRLNGGTSERSGGDPGHQSNPTLKKST
ncbi:hypothetical protein PR001_g20460 [Phytophthora rubi]|uniref:RxLR effector protein n=1 Tax=Phytophthora rubi TaxID=129364 RepID=A0A6A3JRH0_9STRA|nr:hypothetical protein PR001_g20460 [Phytophthora rubi]